MFRNETVPCDLNWASPVVNKGVQNTNGNNSYNNNNTGLSLKPSEYKTTKLSKDDKYLNKATMVNQSYKANFEKKFTAKFSAPKKMTMRK